MNRHGIALALAGALAAGCGSSAPAPSGPPARPAPETPSAATDAPALPLPDGAGEAAEVIDAAALRTLVAELSSDRFEGRGPGTRGDARARGYLARALEELGYRPAGTGGGWEQPFPIVGVTAAMPEVWEFRAPGGDDAVELAWWDDYIAASGVQKPRVELEDREIVFVGYGIDAPEQDWNDFEGADLEGKILLVLNNDPNWDPEVFGGERRQYYGRWTYKYESAARQGAAGAIIIHTTPSAGYPWDVVQTSWSGVQFDLPAGDEPRAPVHGWVTEAAARELVELAGKDLDALTEAAKSRDFSPVPLGVTTSLSFTTKLDTTETANVAGILPGADPELRDEIVVYSAHHDHLGRGKPDDTGDDIYNGARDNAAGVAQALAAARAFSELPEPPRRSVMFVFVGAEEQGLLGSQHFATHPTVARERLVANVNLELGNLWGPTRDVVIKGRGKNTLEDFVEAAARRQDRVVVGEPDPDQGWYYRSDQLSFARAGIPALWFESGTRYEGRPEGWGEQTVSGWIDRHYHRPSDELTDAWEFSGMVEDARLAFWVGLAAATANARPRWHPGDEFADAAPAE